MATTHGWILRGKRPRLVAARMERSYRRQLTLLAGAVQRSARGDEEAARESLIGLDAWLRGRAP